MHQDSQSDHQQYKLPPVTFPRIAPTVQKSIQQSLFPVPDHFKQQSLTINEQSIQSVEFLTDQTFYATGMTNGNINIVSSAQGNTQYVLKGSDSPTSGLASNPDSKHIRHALLATHTDGTLQYWHATSRQLLFSKKYDQMLQTCQISPQGTHYTFSGQLGNIKIGNLNKGDPSELQIGHLGSHDNRVFCIKWNPKNNNIFLSGGWDKTVYFWDIRLKTSVKKLFGYYIGGEAIDFKGNNLPSYPLRIYDGNADKVRSVDWKWTLQEQANHTTGVLSCFYGPEDTIVAATTRNQIRLFNKEKLISQHIVKSQGLKLYCMQNSKEQRKILTGWNDGSIKWLFY